MYAGDRSSQPKTAPRSPAKVVWISRNDTDHTLTLAVGGKRYEFWLTPIQLDTAEYLCKKVSGLRALNYAKSRNRPPQTSVASTS
jgi:hypothetical protein